jgi:hypothetical protein
MVSDRNSGCLAVCLQDSVVTQNTEGRTTKFVANVRPKLLCIPSIFPEHPPVLHDFCFVKSPASMILNTSASLLVTIHDQTLRLWNTDDGRNIMRSPLNLFDNKQPLRIYPMRQDGHILCFCSSHEILIINVYTMVELYSLQGDFIGL